jgi:hypothetical protein
MPPIIPCNGTLWINMWNLFFRAHVSRMLKPIFINQRIEGGLHFPTFTPRSSTTKSGPASWSVMYNLQITICSKHLSYKCPYWKSLNKNSYIFVNCCLNLYDIVYHSCILHIIENAHRSRWLIWLRHCVTIQKVLGSIPSSVTGDFFHGNQQFHVPVVDWASKNEYQYTPGGKDGQWVWPTTYHFQVPMSWNLGALTSQYPLGCIGL